MAANSHSADLAKGTAAMTDTLKDKPWRVVHDGTSYGMLESPTGRIFGLKELGGKGLDAGEWRTPLDNDALCAFFVEVIAHQPSQVVPDSGTEKMLRALLDRAYKMMLQAGYRVQEHDPNHNDPITAWMSDARAFLREVGEEE
jgi:hypothetical protein